MRRQQTSDSGGPRYGNGAHDAPNGDDLCWLLGYDDAQMQTFAETGALGAQPEPVIAAMEV